MKNSKTQRRNLHALDIKDVQHLCRHLGTTREELDKIISRIHFYYRVFPIVRNGKTRVISQPLHRLREIQDVLCKLLQRLLFPVYVGGGIKGVSNLTNAARHLRKPMLLNLDLRDFFPSISHRRVYVAFTVKCGCSPDVARYLTRIVTLDGRLPQGVPTSTVVAALVSDHLMQRLDGLAKKHSGIYGQYVDDATISGPKHVRRLKNTAARIVMTEGFDVHPWKIDTFSQSVEQVVTGAKVNRGLDVTSEFQIRTEKRFAALQSIEPSIRSHSRVAQQLRGSIQYARRLNAESAMGLQDRLNRLLMSDKSTVD